MTNGPHRGGAPAAVVAVGIFAIVAVADALMPLDVSPMVLGLIALVVAARARSRRLLWGLAVAMVVAAFAELLLARSVHYAPARWLLLNRLFVAAAVVAIAAALHRWMIADE